MWDEIQTQEATGELLAAWIAKEELRYLLSLARADVPEATTLARTIEARWAQILAFIGTGITKRPDRGHQQDDQRRPHRIRVPQPRKPAPPTTVALQTDDHQQADARVTSPPNFEEPPKLKSPRFGGSAAVTAWGVVQVSR